MPDPYSQPLFAIALTVGAYAAAQKIHARYTHLHPFLLTTVLLLMILLPTGVPLSAYKIGGDYLTFLLGPATVALAVPLYKNLHHIRRHLLPICLAILVGGLTSITAAWALSWYVHAPQLLTLSLLPKSVTTPIALGIVAQFHYPQPEQLNSLTATLIVTTGLIGAVLGPRFLRLLGIRSELAAGLAMGTSAHGIGTASALRLSELQGSASGLAMALNGLFTTILMIPLYSLLTPP